MKGENKGLNITLTAILGVAIFLFIITFSIGLPIYCRFFYYLQIDSLGLTEASGKSYLEIKQAYDQVLNYLTLPFTEFSTGVFAYSEEGASHFADCKSLFNLNLIVLLSSTAVIITLTVLNKKKKISIIKPNGFFVGFYSAINVFVLFGVLIGLIAIDFERAFVIFHKIFFAGKDNWIFDSDVDQIKRILPNEFFMNCGIFIGVGIIVISIAIIIISILLKIKDKKVKN